VKIAVVEVNELSEIVITGTSAAGYYLLFSAFDLNL
jgi:hypothetical protein